MNRLPCFEPTASPHEAAQRLIAAYRGLGDMAAPVTWTQRAVSADLGPPQGEAERALDLAASMLAAEVDARAAFFDRLPYHNRQHFCEVALAAHFLCRWHDLAPREARLVLLAALVHDFEHDGRPGRAFDYEARSVTAAGPLLRDAGLDDAACEALSALVLATDFAQGVPNAVALHRWHLSGRAAALPPHPAELAALAAQPRLARAAVLLCEADVLPSIGLTLDHAMQLQDRLSHEWQRALPPQDKLRFLDDVVASGTVGAFFMPNVLALRQSLLESLRGRGR
jgi:hypothetical protein